MNARTETGPTPADVVADAAGLVAGLGMVAMVFFPFALPALVLAGAVLAPLLVLALLVAVVAGAIAAPFLAARGLRRRRARS